MKQWLCLLLIIVLALTACSAIESSQYTDGKDSVTGTITLWCHFGDQQEKINEEFNKIYPDITVDIVTVPWANFEEKVNIILAAGGDDVPDIVTVETNWWGSWLNKKAAFEDLGQYSINADNISAMASNVIKNADGEFIVVPISFGIGCIWYCKDMTLKYLDTDDAEILEQKLNSWDDFFELGNQIYQEGGGTEYLFADTCSLEEYFAAANKTKNGDYMRNGKLALDECVLSYFSSIENMLKNQYIAGYVGNDLEQSYVKGNVMFYPYADWHGGSMKDYDKYGQGKWGVMFGPEGAFFRGGEGYLIPQRSKEENKELAAKRINFVLTPEGSRAVINTNQFSAYKYAYTDEILQIEDSYYGERLIKKFYNGFLQIKDKLYLSPNDSDIEKELRLQAYNMMTDGISAEEAIKQATENIRVR